MIPHEVLDKANFQEVTPKEWLVLQNDPHCYSLTWYPYRTDIRDNEIGFYLGNRIIIKEIKP